MRRLLSNGLSFEMTNNCIIIEFRFSNEGGGVDVILRIFNPGDLFLQKKTHQTQIIMQSRVFFFPYSLTGYVFLG